MKLPTKKEQKHISEATQKFFKKRNEYTPFNGITFTKGDKLPTAPKRKR